MPKWRRSAAYRIAFGYSAAFALGVALLGCAVYFAMHAAFMRELDTAVRDEARALSAQSAGEGSADLYEAIDQREAAASHLFYGVYAPDGRKVHGGLLAPRAARGMHNITFLDEQRRPDAGRAFAVELSDGKRLVVAADLDAVERIDRTVVELFLSAFAAIALLGAAGAWLLGGYLRRRLQTISANAEAIIAGDISRRMPVTGRNDEFDELAITLNAMLGRIEGLLDNLRRVSGDVAHDLRTPLARLRNALELGLSSTPTRTRDDPILVDALNRVDEILALFAAILRISEVEGGQIRERFERVDLSALVAEIAESYAPAVGLAGRALEWKVQPGIATPGDRELIAQALVNLIENGQNHTPVGTEIQIALTEEAGRPLLVVQDDGPGVPASDRGRIVERFVRLDKSRQSTGHGLGLNLVAAIARLHGALLQFDDARPGLIIRMVFPAIH